MYVHQIFCKLLLEPKPAPENSPSVDASLRFSLLEPLDATDPPVSAFVSSSSGCQYDGVMIVDVVRLALRNA